MTAFLLKEIWFEFTRSRGPGGQHVNKTNSAALLNWHVQSSAAFSEEQKALIAVKLENHINSEGYLHLRSDQFRDQDQNKKACLEKLDNFLKAALFKPKKRYKTKPTRSAVRERINTKKINGETKKLRGKVNF